MDSEFGRCSICHSELEPVYAKEEDKKNFRWRVIVDYLICPVCGEKECVDDSFDSKWFPLTN